WRGTVWCLHRSQCCHSSAALQGDAWYILLAISCTAALETSRQPHAAGVPPWVGFCSPCCLCTRPQWCRARPARAASRIDERSSVCLLASTEFTTDVLLGVFFLGIVEQLPGVAVFDQIAGSPAARGVDIHERRFVGHTHGLLQIVRDNGNGVF